LITLGLLHAPAALAAPGGSAARATTGSTTATKAKAKAKAPAFHEDRTPLDSSITAPSGSTSTTAVGGTGGDIVRTIVGLAIVLAVIYGVYWLLRSAGRARSGRADERIGVIATTPLAPNRALHLVRAGDELILVGATEHSITPLRVYSGDDALNVEAAASETAFGIPPAEPNGAAGLLEALRRRTVRR
jgi:flagellar protein FliO/FliZ